MPAQKGKSWLERRLKRCPDAGTAPTTMHSTQGSAWAPSPPELKSCSAHYTTPAPMKTSLQKHHHTSTKTPPQDHTYQSRKIQAPCSGFACFHAESQVLFFVPASVKMTQVQPLAGSYGTDCVAQRIGHS